MSVKTYLPRVPPKLSPSSRHECSIDALWRTLLTSATKSDRDSLFTSKSIRKSAASSSLFFEVMSLRLRHRGVIALVNGSGTTHSNSEGHRTWKEEICGAWKSLLGRSSCWGREVSLSVLHLHRTLTGLITKSKVWNTNPCKNERCSASADKLNSEVYQLKVRRVYKQPRETRTATPTSGGKKNISS